ncbi:MAG: carbohydrate kinase family protein [Chloroflexi bacterium]|nr:carbohydrate kinase family protein [Chloroflexota bacterium]
MSNLEVVGLGALNMDYIRQIERLAGDSEIAERTPGHGYPDSELKLLDTCPGGSAANTIYGLAKLGVNTGFIGAVGDDADGKTLLKDFQTVGVDISQIKVKPKAKTGLARCLSDKLNFRSISITSGANSLLTADDINLDYINQAAILHISSFVDDAQLEVLLKLITNLDSSVKVSFSPGELYAAKRLKTLSLILARTHILFINESEIKQLTGEDFISGADRCLGLGCHIVVVTLGQGTSYKTRMATSYIRTAKSVDVVEPSDKSIISTVDTIGAGDAFATGFLYGFIQGQGLKECGYLGSIVAQFSIQKIGARQGLPALGELSQRYRELYGREL